MSRTRFFSAFFFLAVFSFGAFSQTSSGTAEPAEKVKRVLPFAHGETLTYEGKLSKIITVSIADLTFTVDRSSDNENLFIKAEARSKGTLLRLFRFSFLQTIDSTIDEYDFKALRTVKKDVQKDRVRDSEADFNYDESRVTYVEVDPKDPMRPPRSIASELEGDTHDLISAIYSLRMQPLKVGETFNITLSDSGLVYTVPVRVTRRERQRTVLGRVSCFRLEPEIFGPDRLIERDGSMVIWITDDARRVPVRSTVNTNLGRVDIRLRAASGLLK
jgi:hypothetical protein